MSKLYPKATFLVITSIFLAGCQAASPITTTKTFLEALQQQQYDAAVKLLVTSPGAGTKVVSLSEAEAKTWTENTKEKVGNINKFNVQNAIPLREAELAKLGVSEGYEVFYFLESTKGGSQNLNGYLVKLDGSWKLLAPSW